MSKKIDEQEDRPEVSISCNNEENTNMNIQIYMSASCLWKILICIVTGRILLM